MYVLVPEGEPNTATNMEPNQLWDTSSSKFTINCYLMLYTCVFATLVFSWFADCLLPITVSHFAVTLSARCSYFLERSATKIWNPTRIERSANTTFFWRCCRNIRNNTAGPGRRLSPLHWEPWTSQKPTSLMRKSNAQNRNRILPKVTPPHPTL